MNQEPTDAHVALRTALIRDMALQSQLEQQRLEMEKEVPKAQGAAASLVTCRAASERVHQALDALRAAVVDTKNSIVNAVIVHDSEAATTAEMSTTAKARDSWRDLWQLFEALTPQINAATTYTKSHIVNTSDQISTYRFLAECTQHSIGSLDVSLGAIATSLALKREGCSSFFRIPDEVFGIIFQFAVEEERQKLRVQFSSPSISFDTLDDMRKTIPGCPFTLAAVCRQWRNVALHSPKLWSYIRVYTSSRIAPRTNRKPAKYCWVGKAAFAWSLQRAKGTPLELTIYQDDFEQVYPSPKIPSDARISIIYLIRLPSIPRWLPSCLHLSLFGRGNAVSPWDYHSALKVVEFPLSIRPKEISCTSVLPKFLAPLDSTIGFKFCSEHRSQIPDLNQLFEKLPKLELLQLLLPGASAPPTGATIPRTWNSLTTLSITSPALPFLAAHAQQGLSLPSLTTLILTNMLAFFTPNECKDIKHILKTITSLEIHEISSSVKPSDLRDFIDWMECLKTITLHLPPLQKTVKALSITPTKLVERLIVEGTVLEGVELQNYIALLGGPENVSGHSESLGPACLDATQILPRDPQEPLGSISSLWATLI